MAVYYNEIDSFAAAWLRELMKAGQIPDGEVDERAIADVRPDDLRGFDQCHFFAGIGGWAYALRLAGWPDDREVWTGSCPCQPFSACGWGDGEQDSRHLWPVWYSLIRQCRPSVIFGEQVASKAGLTWLDDLFHSLEHAHYSVAAADLCAPSVGAPHIRQRLWFVADTDSEGSSARHERGASQETDAAFAWRQFERIHAEGTWKERSTFSPFSVFTDGIPSRVGQVRGYGNAIVPQVAQVFIESYLDCERKR